MVESIQGWITLLVSVITALGSLITAIVAAVKMLKNKSFAENWKTIQTIAQNAMEAAEKSGAKGAEKKDQVIAGVKAGCAALGIDITPFVIQLEAFIDQSITFVNDMTKK